MNDFIQLRNRCEIFCDSDCQHDLSPLFVPEDRWSEPVQKLDQVLELHRTGAAVGDSVLIGLLDELGKSPYLDRAILNLLLDSRKRTGIHETELELQRRLSLVGLDPEILFHLLDYCIESGSQLLADSRLNLFLRGHLGHQIHPSSSSTWDVLRQLIEYVGRFRLVEQASVLEELLKEPIPESLKLLILDTLIQLRPSGEDLEPLVQRLRSFIIFQSGAPVFLEYLHHWLIPPASTDTHTGLILVQTMFYGDPDTSGKGNSGGLGVLLKSMGNHLAADQEVEQVITLSLCSDWNTICSLIDKVTDKHHIVRMPINLSPDNPTDYVKKQWLIKRSILRAFRWLGIRPDLIHVRYLDNASRAAADAATESGARLVFTLTPDPHRNLSDSDGALREFAMEDALSLSNKVRMGDGLVALADGILGIGGPEVRKELLQYFPQLDPEKEDLEGLLFHMVDEGIETELTCQEISLKELLCDPSLVHSLDETKLNRPVILNVGRLSRLKGQDQLLVAWGDSRLHQDYNLILVGGNSAHPSEEEQRMTDFFQDYLHRRPELAGCFVHLNALSNETVRSLERKLQEQRADFGSLPHHSGLPHQTGLPHLYVCSSKKEEFGLAILEAMVEGFLAFAPKKGGASTYLIPGENGFLLNTASGETMIRELEEILYESGRSLADLDAIRSRARATITQRYSIEKVAKTYLAFYKQVMGRGCPGRVSPGGSGL